MMLTVLPKKPLFCLVSRGLCHTVQAASVVESKIAEFTQVSRSHLTPELQLHLLTPDMSPWHQDPKVLKELFPTLCAQDPFWAIHWPGGQALARYILDHGHVVRGKRVLDLGCGCGSGAISSSMVGAKSVCANDIDPVALEATLLNAKLNDIKQVEVNGDNLLATPQTIVNNFDVVLCGDMFFDEDLGHSLEGLARQFCQERGNLFLVGDPGRWYLQEKLSHHKNETIKCLAKYEIAASDHYGLTHSFVFRFNK